EARRAEGGSGGARNRQAPGWGAVLMPAWNPVSAQSPCPICKHPDWCQVSKDGAVCMCMRIAEGAFRRGQDRSGADYHVHRRIPLDHLPESKPVTAEPDGQRADDHFLHAVYSLVLQELALNDRHRLDLVKRKAPQTFTDRGYRSLPGKGRGKVVA